MRLLSLAVACLLCVAGCARVPDSYPVPVQRKPLRDAEAALPGTIVSMSDIEAEAHFVRDISPGLEGGRWRWTNERPELKIYLPVVERLKLLWEFGIAPATFESTGPVKITFFVNGQVAGNIVCPKPGDYRFEQPVQPSLLKMNEYNVIGAQADKLWTSPTDGVKLGFTLTRAGFVQ